MVPEHMGVHVETSLDRVQDRIHGYEEMLAAMSKQLEETMKQSTKLKLTKSLMAGILALKRAERVLQAIDAAVARAKDKIKHAGERADEIAEHIKRSEVEHRKEVAAQTEALTKLRAGLAKYEKRLTALTARRGRVAGVVRKWKAHVATLRDAHEAYTAGLVGKPAAAGAHANAAAALLGKIPEPPNAAEVLAKLGISVPNKGLRGLLRDGKKDPVTAAIMKGGVDNIEAALAHLQHEAGMRFAAAGAEGAEAAAGDAASGANADAAADADAELERDMAADAQMDEAAAALESELAQAGAGMAAAEADAGANAAQQE